MQQIWSIIDKMPTLNKKKKKYIYGVETIQHVLKFRCRRSIRSSSLVNNKAEIFRCLPRTGVEVIWTDRKATAHKNINHASAGIRTVKTNLRALRDCFLMKVKVDE